MRSTFMTVSRNMHWKFYIGACILVVGLLFKNGAPLATILGGVALAGLWHWYTGGVTPSWMRPRPRK